MQKLTGKPLAKPPRARPWQRRRPRPYRRELVTLDRAPLAQIDIYNECVVLTRRRPNGSWTSYPVSPDAVAQVLGKLPVSTGILPPGLLASGMREGVPYYVLYIPARVTALQLDDGGRYLTRRIPLPPLIWASWGRNYRIWATKATFEPSAEGDPISPRTLLYKAPFPNVFTSAGICWGDVGQPRPASPETLRSTLKLFLEESRFNSHLDDGRSKAQPGSVLRIYEQLEQAGAERYPLDDLVSAEKRLSQVIDGSIWGRG